MRARLAEVLHLFDRPLTSYYVIFGSMMLLIALGLIMVLSSSSIDSLTETGSPYTLFRKQVISVVIGLPLMLVASRLPPRVYRVIAYPLMVVAVLGLVAVLFMGDSYATGAVRWINIGGLTIQPSEPAKLAFVIWGADLLARKEELNMLTEWRHLLVPLMPGVGVLTLLVLLGRDLGTSLVLMTAFLALLWVVGAPGRLFVGMLGLVALLVAIMVVVEPYRMDRLTSFIDPAADPGGTGYQAMHGRYALGSGGLLGVGIGASREKWQYLPHPESDFIFAIIGEELGLVGSLLVIGLFGLFGYAGIRVAQRVRDPFMRLAATALTAWIVVQALVNIGAVIGVLPITGIPLPLVSSGGSALVPTMFALGTLLSFAKREPGARQALAARGPGLPVRALSWLGLGSRKR
ncbi:MAG: putative lipid II flippase FtsW [Streptosporangiales bacterium]|nr:putative lipid II flippase FtsW [Streptosporangiales bacterium]